MRSKSAHVCSSGSLETHRFHCASTAICSSSIAVDERFSIVQIMFLDSCSHTGRQFWISRAFCSSSVTVAETMSSRRPWGVSARGQRDTRPTAATSPVSRMTRRDSTWSAWFRGGRRAPRRRWWRACLRACIPRWLGRAAKRLPVRARVRPARAAPRRAGRERSLRPLRECHESAGRDRRRCRRRAIRPPGRCPPPRDEWNAVLAGKANEGADVVFVAGHDDAGRMHLEERGVGAVE